MRSELDRVTAALDLHTVYQAGQARTVAVGTLRMWTIVLFGFGIVVVAPSVYQNPEYSTLWTPLVIVGGAVPMLLIHFLTVPFVATVRVSLPHSARASKAATLRFASNVPPNTEMQIQCFGVWPWPRHRRVFFEDLRRKPGSRFQLYNLEHVPLGIEKAYEEGVDKRRDGRLAKLFLGGYSIDRAQARDRSETPGAWDRMWEQIPLKGEEPVKKVKKNIPPPVDIERPAWSSPSKPRPRMPPPRR